MANLIRIPAKTRARMTGIYDEVTGKCDVIDFAYDYRASFVPWAYWKFEESSVPCIDATGHGHDLILDPAYGADIRFGPGKVGNCFYTVGVPGQTSGYQSSGLWVWEGWEPVNVGEVGGDFTFAFWAWVSGTYSGWYPDCIEINSNAGVDIWIEDDGNAYIQAWTNWQSVGYWDPPYCIVPKNQWNFFVVWADRDGLSVEMNNVLVLNDPYDGTGFFNQYDVTYVGFAAGNDTVGKVDEFGIWNRALDAGERASLWNGGAGRTLYA